VWRDDLVSFVSLLVSFEEALLAADVPVRHIELAECADVSNEYRNATHGAFPRPLVVSDAAMNPRTRSARADHHAAACRARRAGASDSEAIGISDLAKPIWDAVPVGGMNCRVLACGVTPQEAIAAARVPSRSPMRPGSCW